MKTKAKTPSLLLGSNGQSVITQIARVLGRPARSIRLAYITTASKGVTDHAYIKRHCQLMKRFGYQFHEIDIEKMTDFDFEYWLKADAFYLEGGNTFYLLRAIRRTGFMRFIKEAVRGGRLYVGSSAGSYVACPSIITSTWKSDPKLRYGMKSLKGMNLVPFIMRVHFKPEMKAEIIKGLRRTKYPLRILKDGQALLVEGKQVKLVGLPGEIRIH